MTSHGGPEPVSVASQSANGQPIAAGALDSEMRRHPEIFVAAAVAAGFLVARIFARIGRSEEE